MNPVVSIYSASSEPPSSQELNWLQVFHLSPLYSVSRALRSVIRRHVGERTSCWLRFPQDDRQLSSPLVAVALAAANK
jgi:hypothetical protein